MAYAKIKRTKYMRNINDNAVQGRLFENYLTRKLAHKIFSHEIFAIYGRKLYVFQNWNELFSIRSIRLSTVYTSGIAL